MPDGSALSRRERQIMDVIYARRQATAAEVRAAISDPPSYSAIRALLRILEQKGHLRHESIEGKHVYLPTQPRKAAARQALRRLLNTFFENSTSKAVAALLSLSDMRLSEQELGELSQLIEKAKKGNKP